METEHMLIRKFTDVAKSVENYEDILKAVKPDLDEAQARKQFIRMVRDNSDIMFDDQAKIVPTTRGWKAIHAINKQFPEREISDRFLNAITMPDGAADQPILSWALAEMFGVTRTGFTEKGLMPHEAQNNGEHVNNMLAMADDTLVRAKIVLHDIAEGLTTDFSKPLVAKHGLGETKERLEKIAAAILMQKEPALFQLWMEYEDKATWRDTLVKELDNLEHEIYVGEVLSSGVPEYMHAPFIEAVQDTVRERMKHPHYQRLARDCSNGNPSEILALPAPDTF